MLSKVVVTVLTTNGLGLPVDVGDLRVHLDEHLPLLHDLLVSLVDPLLHPGTEALSNDGVDDVGDVGPGHLQNLLLHFRQRGQDQIVVLAELEEVLDA